MKQQISVIATLLGGTIAAFSGAVNAQHHGRHGGHGPRGSHGSHGNHGGHRGHRHGHEHTPATVSASAPAAATAAAAETPDATAPASTSTAAPVEDRTRGSVLPAAATPSAVAVAAVATPTPGLPPLPPVSVAAPSAPLGAADLDQGNASAMSDGARNGWTGRTAATARPWLTSPSLVHQAHLGWLTVDGSYEHILTNDPIRTRSLGQQVSASTMDAGGVRFGFGFVFGSIGIRVFCAYQVWTTTASPLVGQPTAKSTDVGLNLRSYMLRGIRFQPFIGLEGGARVWNSSLIVSAGRFQGTTANLVMMQGAVELGFRLRIAERFAVEAVGFAGLGLNAGNAFSDNIVSTGFRIGFGL